MVLKTTALASCTTSLFYVNLFHRTLSFGCSLVKNSLSALASSVVRSRKRMQRYSFFGHEPNVSREKFVKRAHF